jgi:glycosyltransferase involved in cell wall biosynthesis
MNQNITAMVFALNEAHRLPLIFENLKDFCKIVVFDGGSTDGTEEFCKQNGIDFIRRPTFTTNLSPDPLKWVHGKIDTGYVLHVFGAHYFPTPLLAFFSKAANENKLDAVYHDVVIYRYGGVVHRPPIRRISSGCNFYRKSSVKYENYIIHNELGLEFNQNTMVRLPGRDELSLHLFQDEDCESYTKKTISYAAAEARHRFARGERVTFTGILLKPIRRFIYQYIRAGSFLYGSRGLAYATMNLIYDINMSIIIWELENELTLLDAVQKNDAKKRHFLQKKN